MANLNPSYGTAEYYKQQFDDMICEVSDADYQHMDALVEGLMAAIDDWENYHIESAKRYGSFRERIRKA